MKVKEVINKSENELINDLKNFKKELMNLRFQKISGALSNTSRVRLVRRSIARIKTILNKRKLGDK